MKDLNIIYIQADLKWEDKEANLQHFSKLLEEVQPDTDLILLPETFTTGFPVESTAFRPSGKFQRPAHIHFIVRHSNSPK